MTEKRLLTALEASLASGNDGRIFVWDNTNKYFVPRAISTYLADILTARGQIIRRGASAPEALNAKTAGKVLIGDGIDVVSDDGDDISIALSPSNYTAGTADLKGHLAGIDTALGSVGGKVLKRGYVESSAVATGTTQFDLDDTPPTTSEGNLALTLAFQPTASASRLRVNVSIMMAHGGAGHSIVTVFRGSTCVAVLICRRDSSNNIDTLSGTFEVASGTTSSESWTVRYGSHVSGTATLNGQSGSRLFSTVPKSFLVITEIEA